MEKYKIPENYVSVSIIRHLRTDYICVRMLDDIIYFKLPRGTKPRIVNVGKFNVEVERVT